MADRRQPRYLQVADRLQVRIDSGHLPAGSRLPSERALAEEFGLSRMTARQAVELLVRRGSVYRRPGSGTFVGAGRIDHTLQRLAGFTEQMRAQGIDPGARLLEARLAPLHDRESATALDMSPGEPAWSVRRVRTGNGEPLVLEAFLVPAGLCPGLDRHDLAARSLYDLLRDVYGIDAVRARETIEPAACEADEAALLDDRPGAPALLVRRTTYARDGRPVEHARDLYRGDRARFVVDLQRD